MWKKVVDTSFFSQRSPLQYTHVFTLSENYIYTSNLVTISLSKHLNFRQFSLIKNIL